MLLHIEPPSALTGTASPLILTPTEILTAIVPALIGTATVALIAVLMLL